MAKELKVKCKRCNKKDVAYSGMMYQKIKELGQSRPEYCDECRRELLLEKMTMGAAYFGVKTWPGADLSEPIPGELGMVYHPPRPHEESDIPPAFDASKFGATPGKIVEIYEWLKDPDHQVAIVIGETGSGKSTALPYWLIHTPEGIPEGFFTDDGQILITQPRIVATTEIAKYLGTLLGSNVGKGFDIGYRYSKDRNTDRANAAFFATDGSLISMIARGQLEDLSVIMIDEAHERSLNIDLILRLLKDQLPLYPHLKLLIVSATINEDLFLKYFGEETAKIIRLEGRRKFDYQTHYASEDEKLPYENPNQLRKLVVPALVKKTVWLLKEIINGRRERGHILTFLQGVRPIDEAVKLIEQAVESDAELREKVEVFPLYSDLDDRAKEYALKGKERDKLRVIVSTNIAEASVTVDGIVYVIESGIENQANWNIANQEQTVGLNLISQANARQRHGRSGRTRPGEVFCLYTEEQYKQMPKDPVAAIQRSNLDDIVLLLKSMGVDDLAEGWIEAPLEEELARSYASLQKAGAIDEDGFLTEYGTLLMQFSYPAALADLVILADRFGCVVEIATLLPVIRNGGQKGLLMWDNNWDMATKKAVGKIHEMLASGCWDDVEFILKLYSMWLDPPGPTKDERGKEMNLAERRSAWAEKYYINPKVIAEIANEREQILSLLSARKKDRNVRSFEWTLLERVRMVLALKVGYTLVAEDETYTFDTRLEPKPGSPVALKLAIPEKIEKAVEQLREQAASPTAFGRELITWEAESEDGETVAKRLFAVLDAPMVEAEVLTNDEWRAQICLTYPTGTVIQAKVKGIVPIGVIFGVEDGLKGFARLNPLNINVGETLFVKVIGYDNERRQLTLTLKTEENSPLRRLKVKQVLQGVVTGLTDYGAFVDLGLGFSGLLHKSEMGQRVRVPADLLAKGDPVEVEILDLVDTGEKIKISLRLVAKKQVVDKK